jgi:hypothetical protein
LPGLLLLSVLAPLPVREQQADLVPREGLPGARTIQGVLRHSQPVLRKAPSFLNVSYVCPEPVLVKRSFLCINCSKRGVFRTASGSLASTSDAPDRSAVAIASSSPAERNETGVRFVEISHEKRNARLCQDRLRTNTRTRWNAYCELHNNRPKTAETSAIRVS